MKSFAYLTAALTLLSSAFAVEMRKQVIVSYPNDTPDSVLDQAKEAIVESGGAITHEFELIKGFAATVGEKVLETVKSLGQQYNPTVEEDQVISIS